MYENAKYISVVNGEKPQAIFVFINGIPCSVPLDPANSDFAAIMALAAEGKLTIAPAEGAN